MAQDVEEDWFLEVYGHDGKATNVTMKPGDMVLYESHSVIHGRPFPLNGKFYANIFVHFEPMGDAQSTEPLPKNGGHPPYLIADSPWGESYFRHFPDGWTLLSNLQRLATVGDLYTMRYIAQREPDSIKKFHNKCSLMKLATVDKHIDVLEFLIHEMNYDVNMVCRLRTPLDYAKEVLDEDDAVITFLQENGGRTGREFLQPQSELTIDDRCDMLEAAVDHGEEVVLEFLFEELEFDINMICFEKYTPRDLFHNAYDEDDEENHTVDSHDLLAYLVHNGGLPREKLHESQADIDSAIVSDNRCFVVQTAIEFESTDVLDFLVDAMHFDINIPCNSLTPLDLAYATYGNENHHMIEHINSLGGRTYYTMIGHEAVAENIYRRREQCFILSETIRLGNPAVLDFLMKSSMGYEVNMICKYGTPMDAALRWHGDEDVPIIGYLSEHGGISSQDLYFQEGEDEDEEYQGEDEEYPDEDAEYQEEDEEYPDEDEASPDIEGSADEDDEEDMESWGDEL